MHADDLDADQVRIDTKKRWSTEELFRLAVLEARALNQGMPPRTINAYLNRNFPQRSLEAIKGARRKEEYKLKVQTLRLGELPDTTEHDDSAAIEDANSTDEPLIEAILNSNLGNSTRYQTSVLREVAESVREGNKAATLALLTSYLINVFPPVQSTTPRPHRRPPVQSNGRIRRRMEYATTQKRWTKNRSRCIQAILDGITEHRMPARNRMVAYWSTMFTGSLPGTITPKIASTEIDSQIWAPITEDDLKRCRVAASSSPGPDGMTATDMNMVPRTIRATVMNLMMWCRKCPEVFHEARTVMLPKVSGADKPEEFRPITISPILCRSLHKVLADRLGRTSINSAQRAFIKTDGCADNITLVDTLIKDSRRRFKSLYMAQLDLAKAFDTVTHDAILAALKGNKAPAAFVEYLTDVYKGQTTRIIGDGWRSDVIAPTRGVRQGDPLSPVIFNLVMDGLIAKLPTHIGYLLGETRVNCVAYADDITLMAETKEGLDELLTLADEYLRNCGLLINTSKSRTLAFQGQPKEKRQVVLASTTFSVNGQTLLSTKRTDRWTYLGIDFNGEGRAKVDCDISGEIARLDRAALKPQQRMFALRTCLIPRTFHLISLGLIAIGRLNALDRQIRRVARKWLKLPQDVPKAYFHGAISDGCLGLPSLRWFGPMLRAKRIGRIISSNSISCNYLNSEVSKAKGWTWWRGGFLETSDQIRNMWATALTEAVDGVGLREACKVKSANTFMGDGSRLLSGRDYVHIAQARIGALYSRSRVTRGRPGLSRHCRAGCGRIETANHISQTCRSTKQHRIDRHNVLVRTIVGSLQEKGYTVAIEPRVNMAGGNAIPDIVATLGDTSFVIDVQVVGDQCDLDERHMDKVIKYSGREFVDAVKAQFGSADVRTTSCTLNWRGVWSKCSFEDLKQLGIVSSYTSKLYSIKTVIGTYISNRMFNGQALDEAEDELSLLEDPT